MRPADPQHHRIAGRVVVAGGERRELINREAAEHLINTVAGEHVAQQVAGLADGNLAGRGAKRLLDALELIDAEVNEVGGLPVARRQVEQSGPGLHESARVQQAGDIVAQGRRAQGAHQVKQRLLLQGDALSTG